MQHLYEFLGVTYDTFLLCRRRAVCFATDVVTTGMAASMSSSPKQVSFGSIPSLRGASRQRSPSSNERGGLHGWVRSDTAAPPAYVAPRSLHVVNEVRRTVRQMSPVQLLHRPLSRSASGLGSTAFVHPAWASSRRRTDPMAEAKPQPHRPHYSLGLSEKEKPPELFNMLRSSSSIGSLEAHAYRRPFATMFDSFSNQLRVELRGIARVPSRYLDFRSHPIVLDDVQRPLLSLQVKWAKADNLRRADHRAARAAAERADRCRLAWLGTSPEGNAATTSAEAAVALQAIQASWLRERHGADDSH